MGGSVSRAFSARAKVRGDTETHRLLKALLEEHRKSQKFNAIYCGVSTTIGLCGIGIALYFHEPKKTEEPKEEP